MMEVMEDSEVWQLNLAPATLTKKRAMKKEEEEEAIEKITHNR